MNAMWMLITFFDGVPTMCHLLQWLTFALANSKQPGAATCVIVSVYTGQ